MAIADNAQEDVGYRAPKPARPGLGEVVGLTAAAGVLATVPFISLDRAMARQAQIAQGMQEGRLNVAYGYGGKRPAVQFGVLDDRQRQQLHWDIDNLSETPILTVISRSGLACEIHLPKAMVQRLIDVPVPSPRKTKKPKTEDVAKSDQLLADICGVSVEVLKANNAAAKQSKDIRSAGPFSVVATSGAVMEPVVAGPTTVRYV